MPSRMKRLSVVSVVVCALAVCAGTASAAATRQASAPTQAAAVCDTGHVYFAKTKFVFHMGLAFGAFYRYIYKPFQTGAFKSGAPGRLKAGIKAALAAAFVYHELKLACKDANSSSLLRPLLIPINAAVTLFTSLEQKLKSGSFGVSDLTGAGGAINSLGQKSKSLGLPIQQLFGGFTGG